MARVLAIVALLDELLDDLSRESAQALAGQASPSLQFTTADGKSVTVDIKQRG